MKVEIQNYESKTVATIEVDGNVEISEAFSGVGITTVDGSEFGVSERGSGLDVVCPDGTVVGIRVDASGKIVLERDCRVVDERSVGGDLIGPISSMLGPLG